MSDIYLDSLQLCKFSLILFEDEHEINKYTHNK